MPLLDSTQVALEAAMRGAMLRQTLLTNNLANVETPGYRRQDVNFQATLSAAMQTGQPLDQLSFSPVTEAQPPEADRESANLAENGLDYQALAQTVSARDSILQYAIGTR